jgi:hypothetical protein
MGSVTLRSKRVVWATVPDNAVPRQDSGMLTFQHFCSSSHSGYDNRRDSLIVVIHIVVARMPIVGLGVKALLTVARRAS